MNAAATLGSTRSRIMQVTATLLAGMPSSKVTNRLICDAAGITAPTLYHHFGDKEQLFEAVAVEAFTQYLATKQSMEHLPDVADDFRRGWRMHVEFAVINPALYSVLFADAPALRASDAAQAVHDELTRFIEHIEATGRLRLPIHLATDIAYSAATGLALQLIRTNGSVDDDIVHLMCDAVMGALISPSTTLSPPTKAVAEAASSLKAILPEGAMGALGTAEMTLLRQWLTSLT